jgi:hypothetical protein
MASWPAFALALGLAFSATPAAGQSPPVRGILYESGTERPVATAAVYLLEESTAVDAALSDAEGRFRLVAPRSGLFRLQVDRIGFESEVSQPFDVPPAGTFGIAMGLRVSPIELDALAVEADRVCDVDLRGSTELVRVWQEARKALTTTMLGGRTGSAEFLLELTESRLDRDLDVETSRSDTLVVAGDHGFDFVAIEELERDGWGRMEGEVMARFFGPSPETLLSTWFGANHCLSLGEERDEDSNIGLAFESIEDSLAIGMEGTFWIDPADWHLRRITFRYTGSSDLERARHQGGDIELAVDPGAGWYVREWRLRRPILERGPLEVLPGGGRVRTVARRSVVVGYEERRGRVLRRN